MILSYYVYYIIYNLQSGSLSIIHKKMLKHYIWWNSRLKTHSSGHVSASVRDDNGNAQGTQVYLEAFIHIFVCIITESV